MKCHLQTQLSSYEKKAVLDILARSFPLDYQEGYELFNFTLDNIPAIKFLLVKDQTDKIIGLSCLLDREFNYFGIVMKLVGLSYMAVLPEFRDFSVTSAIKNSIFGYLTENSHLSIGFARKKMDGYWYPYGYLGFTNFGQLSVDTKFLPQAKPNFYIKPMEATHIPQVHELFELTYQQVLGPLKRNAALWGYYFKKVKREQINAEVIFKKNRIVGYIFGKENAVYELGLEDSFASGILSLLGRRAAELNQDQMHFQIGYEHPLMPRLRCFSHIFAARHVWNGGHIVRITSLIDFLHKITPILELRLVNAKIRDFVVECGGFVFRFAKGKLQITESQVEKNGNAFTFDNKSLHDWQKILFGVIPADEVVNGVSSQDKEIFKIMFPVVAPQVPLIDQF